MLFHVPFFHCRLYALTYLRSTSPASLYETMSESQHGRKCRLISFIFSLKIIEFISFLAHSFLLSTNEILERVVAQNSNL